jgi:thiamine biosynthesis lipoprotein ApbE
VASATVLTGDAWRAEVLAKAVVLAGAAGAAAVLEAGSATGLVVDRLGQAHPAPGLARFLV